MKTRDILNIFSTVVLIISMFGAMYLTFYTNGWTQLEGIAGILTAGFLLLWVKD